MKPPTGIPKSMLMATPDGSYALPSGAVAVLKPNEYSFSVFRVFKFITLVVCMKNVFL